VTPHKYRVDDAPFKKTLMAKTSNRRATKLKIDKIWMRKDNEFSSAGSATFHSSDLERRTL
jgi:hypothetical protein